MSLARLSARELALNAAAAAAISSLPDLDEKDVDNLDDSCPICLLSFRSLLDGTADEVLGESSMGLTKVEACGHIFCMNDLAEWIRGKHGTCPACRHPFLPELLATESDDESSDGGEYVPTEYEADTDMDTDYEDDRDGFFGSDGVDIETMELEDDASSAVNTNAVNHESAVIRTQSPYVRRVANEPRAHIIEESWWDSGSVDGEHEWGLTDGESMSASDDGMYHREDDHRDTDIQVRLDSEGEYALQESEQGPTSDKPSPPAQ
ncbi:unnamed protein product [Peniophora sp. CBMAI 1063]|nr:unnamed protein product [Peniophora sp. CBMAI 1063]